MAYIFMAYKWGVILTTYDTWEPILQATPPPNLGQLRSGDPAIHQITWG